LLRRVLRLWDPVTLQLWLDEHRDARGARAFAIRQAAIFILTFRHLRDDEISRRAASLTYFTLLSLVPLLAVGFALFKAFGGLQKLEAPLKQFIIENLAVGSADGVGHFLDAFVAKINAGAIAGVGVLVLFYSAVGLLTSAEQSFNRIWGIEKMRPLHLRFAIYWCLITLAPPLLGVSLSLSAQLQRSAFAAMVMQWLPFGLGRLLVSGVAALAICLAFTLAFVIVPNTRVRFRAALLGGLAAGLLWSACKAAFLWLTAGSAKYSAVYGALSALPLLILWLYYSWLITLFGVTFTFANQTIASNALFARTLGISPAFRQRLAARLLLAVVARFRDGAAPPTADALAEEVGVVSSVVRPVLALLEEHGVLRETAAEGVAGYVPGRDLESLTLADLSRALWQGAGTALRMNEDEVVARLAPILERAEQAREQVLAETPLRELA
jgi:membrane protein